MKKRGWMIAAGITLLVSLVGLFFNPAITGGFLLGSALAVILYWSDVRFVDGVLQTAHKSTLSIILRTVMSILLMATGMILAVKFPQVFHLAAVVAGLFLIKVSLVLQEWRKGV